MKIFVTGASGWIGSAVVPELLNAGHQVVGLARSEESVIALKQAGVEVVAGDLDDIETLKSAAKDSDGVLHLAFKHDMAFSGNYQGAIDADWAAVRAYGEALKGTEKPLVIASGLFGGKPGELFAETDGHDMDINEEIQGPAARHAIAEYVLSLAKEGVRSSIIRLAPTNHGNGDNGFIKSIVGIAKEKGIAGYIGEGSNRWPAIHRLDSAHLFRLAIEKAPAGSTLHGLAEEGIQMKDIAKVIGKHLDVPVKPVSKDDASEHFGWMAGFIGMDILASNSITRSSLNWEPVQIGLIDDLEQEHYYKT